MPQGARRSQADEVRGVGAPWDGCAGDFVPSHPTAPQMQFASGPVPAIRRLNGVSAFLCHRYQGRLQASRGLEKWCDPAERRGPVPKPRWLGLVCSPTAAQAMPISGGPSSSWLLLEA